MGATVLRNSGGPVPSRYLFAVSVENRNAETLRAIIARHVLPGGIVRTDLWRGYRALTRLRTGASDRESHGALCGPNYRGPHEYH